MSDSPVAWSSLRFRLQVARSGGKSSPPQNASVDDWREWASAYSVPIFFKGRSGHRSVGPLDLVLKRLTLELQKVYTPPAAAHGFVPGRSTLSAARPHVGAEKALTVDLKDFFGQVSQEDVRVALDEFFDDDAASVIIGIALNSNGLPLGFRTSPVISNIVFAATDHKLTKLCRENGIAYTRWVDDMIFSGPSVGDSWLARITELLKSCNWDLNTKKTRFMNTRRVVLGLNVAQDLDRPHVPRGIKKELRKQLYYMEKFGIDHFSHETAWPLPRILGMIAYVKSIDRALGEQFEAQVSALPEQPRLLSYSHSAGGGKWQRRLLEALEL